jgi:hypothetical protein
MREHALKALDTLVAHVTEAGGIAAATAQQVGAA